MHRTYSSRLCFTNRHIFVYIAGIRKQLLFHCPRIHTLHLYLKHPRCTSQPMDSNEMTWLLLPTSWKPWTPIVHIVPSMVPPRMYGIHRECLHPSVNQLRDTALMASALLAQPPRAPAILCSDLRHPALACVVCSCGHLWTLLPKTTFLPLTRTLSKGLLSGQGSANSPRPPPVLSVSTGPWQLHSPVN